MFSKSGTAGTITIRMYRGLLGDCFLLTHRVGKRSFKALIDCGVLQCIGATKPATEAALNHMQTVAADLKAHTGGKLDLMIATHAHYDHLSGFIVAFDILSQLEIKALWLAWTENLDDPWSNALRQKGVSARTAIKTLLDEAEAAKGGGRADHPLALAADDPRMTALADLMQFYGEIEPVRAPGVLAAAAAGPVDLTKTPRSCEGVIEWLKAKTGAANVRYLEPGEMVEFGVDRSIKAHVLGPPRDIDRLKQMDPKAGAAKEVYLVDPTDSKLIETVLKFQAADPARPVLTDLPFSRRFATTPDQRRTFETYDLYNGLTEDPRATPEERMVLKAEADSRRIDTEWLGSAEALALKVDGDVNNTSLALAFELPDGEVLLFPADAQVGNWLSWRDQTYPKPKDKDGPEGVTVDDLLSRVIFYKVGHHASHNATLREHGLEKMKSPHLAAMIPVVRAVAAEQKSKTNPKGWSMPYPGLFERLNELANKRVLTGDGVRAEEKAAFADSVFGLRYPKRRGDALWVELTYPRDPTARTAPRNTPGNRARP
ncbi:MAG TPA: hypothetical protein VEA44_05530 [Caulobacter sp.]|nr:hypothetical protein [Caulobacter sp.]